MPAPLIHPPPTPMGLHLDAQEYRRRAILATSRGNRVSVRVESLTPRSLARGRGRGGASFVGRERDLLRLLDFRDFWHRGVHLSHATLSRLSSGRHQRGRQRRSAHTSIYPHVDERRRSPVAAFAEY